ncbi:hypothetical protein KAX17_02555 [Candidatus Bipolaricaulota bacterium]|nr:hypothetical protein [Candidatus Bipolaricaulota bacterium]
MRLECQQCGSQSIAEVLYGLPSYSEELRRDLASGKIVLGGCTLRLENCHCNDCGHEWVSPKAPVLSRIPDPEAEILGEERAGEGETNAS